MFGWDEDVEGVLSGCVLLADIFLHLLSDASRLNLFLFHLMQNLLVLGPQCSDVFPVLFSLLAQLCLSLANFHADGVEFVLESAYLFELYFSGPLCLFSKASKLVSFELQCGDVFFHPSSKLQILLSLSHKLDQAS